MSSYSVADGFGSDLLVLQTQLRRHGRWTVELLAVLLTAAPLSYAIAKKVASRRKPQVVDGLTLLMRHIGSNGGDKRAQEQTAEYILELQRQTDDEFAANVASWAQRAVLKEASALAKRRALAALDLCLAFLVVRLIDRCARGTSPLFPSFVSRCLAPPSGFSLFGFYDLVGAAEFNVLLRLPVVRRLPELVPLCFLSSVTATADTALLRRVPDELLESMCRSCTARQLALWQVLVSSTPSTLVALVREGLCSLLFNRSGANGGNNNAGAANQKKPPPSIFLRIRRAVVPSLLSAVFVYFSVQHLAVEGSVVASALQRWLPSRITDKGIRYTVSCAASLLFVALMPKQK